MAELSLPTVLAIQWGDIVDAMVRTTGFSNATVQLLYIVPAAEFSESLGATGPRLLLCPKAKVSSGTSRHAFLFILSKLFVRPAWVTASLL